ncbi:hypothetical protein K7W42_22330 [Deinococcus sp. HMF7604]|uniref:hypothetical protein n=1 Tax=Deinococcus betulae TaxID=2873312 RepID=UPI001CCCD78E|nr:hypothetical protein [Deinococcus betulae]MBZ9753572.1 hypothetical protein [Deinococcus betulae]
MTLSDLCFAIFFILITSALLKAHSLNSAEATLLFKGMLRDMRILTLAGLTAEVLIKIFGNH